MEYFGGINLYKRHPNLELFKAVVKFPLEIMRTCIELWSQYLRHFIEKKGGLNNLFIGENIFICTIPLEF